MPNTRCRLAIAHVQWAADGYHHAVRTQGAGSATAYYYLNLWQTGINDLYEAC